MQGLLQGLVTGPSALSGDELWLRPWGSLTLALC